MKTSVQGDLLVLGAMQARLTAVEEKDIAPQRLCNNKASKQTAP
jgi:hypothetical protein